MNTVARYSTFRRASCLAKSLLKLLQSMLAGFGLQQGTGISRAKAILRVYQKGYLVFCHRGAVKVQKQLLQNTHYRTATIYFKLGSYEIVQLPATSWFPQTEVLTSLQSITSDGQTAMRNLRSQFGSFHVQVSIRLGQQGVLNWANVVWCAAGFGLVIARLLLLSSPTCPPHLPPLILSSCCQRSRPLRWSESGSYNLSALPLSADRIQHLGNIVDKFFFPKNLWLLRPKKGRSVRKSPSVCVSTAQTLMSSWGHGYLQTEKHFAKVRGSHAGCIRPGTDSRPPG